jgi:hypothetical protein
MSSTTITAEGGTIKLTTAESGEVTAVSSDFSVTVVQQVQVVGGVTQYATVQELITASQGTLDAGHYEVSGLVLTYWDGTDFRDSDGGNIIELSPIMDHLADVALWFSVGNKYQTAAAAPPDGATLTSWRATDDDYLATTLPGGTVTRTTIAGRDAINCNNSALQVANSARGNVLGSFEIFAVVQLANAVETNAGICGTWNGSNGILFMSTSSASPYDVIFGFDGAFAYSGSRLNTAPHVVSGRYDGANVTLSIDGVDVDSAAKTGTYSNAAAFCIGGYDAANSATWMQGKISEIVKIDKELTTQERADIVAHLMASVGI